MPFPIVEKIRDEMSTWKAKALYFAGMVTLPKVVLQSIPIYLMYCVLKKVERYFRFFLWCHDEMRKGVHVVAWDTICRDKAVGGLGIR